MRQLWWALQLLVVPIAAMSQTGLGNVLEGMSPGLGGSSTAFYAFFCVCYLRLVGKPMKFVSALVGIAAVRCTDSNVEPKPCWAMCQKD